jgi:hypothetical protein
MLRTLLRQWCLRRRRKKYRVGALFTRFVACDIRRDIKIVDASEVEDGLVTVTSRTWNVLYADKGIVPKPEFGEPERVAIEKPWEWKGPSWGGPVLEREPKDKARETARMVRGGPCQSRATSRRSMNKSELTAKANDVTKRRLEHWPAFDLFRLAERCFIECVEDLPEGSFNGEYYEILSGLRSTFSQMATVESAFANIFLAV